MTDKHQIPAIGERPQDPHFDGTGWTFATIEHGGAEPDTMPQAILATDAEGRSWIYVAAQQPPPASVVAAVRKLPDKV